MSAAIERATGWVAIPDAKELSSCAEIPTIYFKSFPETTDYLLGEPPGVAILDSDNTIRDTLWHGSRLRFGEIPSDSIDRITRLVDAGWEVIVASNQRREGHQIARLFASWKGYKFFPDALEELLGKDRIFGATGLPWVVYKKTAQSTKQIAECIHHLPINNITAGLYKVGDKISDGNFLARLSSHFSADIPATFCKLPDPHWIMQKAF